MNYYVLNGNKSVVGVPGADVYSKNNKKETATHKIPVDLQLTIHIRNFKKMSICLLSQLPFVQVLFNLFSSWNTENVLLFLPSPRNHGDGTVNFDIKMTHLVNEQLFRPIYC